MKIPAARHVAHLFRWEKRLVARFFVTAAGRAIAQLAAVLLIRDFLSGAIGEQTGVAHYVAGAIGPDAVLWTVAVLLFVSYVGGSLLAYDNQIVQQRIVKVLELGMMERIIRHLMTLSVPFFDRQSHGDIVEAVRGDVSRMRASITCLANIVLEGLTALSLLAAAFWLSPQLTLWALVVLPAACFPIFYIAKRVLAHSFHVRKTGYVLFDIILEVVRGIREIKAYSGEQAQSRITVDRGRAYFDELIRIVRVRALSTVVLESLAGLGTVVVIVVGGLQVMEGTLTWPTLLAFVMAMRAMHGPLNNLNKNYVGLQEYGASMQRLAELLGEVPEIRDAPEARALAHPPGTIALHGVGFSYGEAEVLHGVSFEVRAGETVGIAGPSGAGKTTLLNLIVRFFDPSTGRVEFDGVDLRAFKLVDVYARIAIVTQEPFLFAASVRDNIRCGRPSASDEEVEAAARAAYVHEEIMGLPDGYETKIGVAGRSLSGGQRQRVSIARALLKNAPILLLDEATSSLDSVAEAEVQRAIENLIEGRTTFVVAHRLSTLRNATRILVLDHGHLVGFAAHQELLDTCGVYAQLWAAQQFVVPGRSETA